MSGPDGPTATALEGYGASSRIHAALPEMPGGMAKVDQLLDAVHAHRAAAVEQRIEHGVRDCLVPHG